MTTLDQITEISDAIQQYVSDEMHDKLIKAITRLAEDAYNDGQTVGFRNGEKAGFQNGMQRGSEVTSKITSLIMG